MTRPLLMILAALVTMAWAVPAQAQLTVQRTPSSVTPNLGDVIRGSAPTTFSIATSGVVTRTSGDAIRVTTGGVTPPAISIVCQLDVACNLRDMRVTIQITGSSGVAAISNLRVSSTGGFIYRIAPPADGPSITFDTYPIGLNLVASFVLGMDVLVPTSGSTGPGTYSYTVTVTLL